MPSVDLQYIRSRQREMRHAIRLSSPALVYSGSIGIVIIAANKSQVRDRIGKILDRMAVVSRGELTASDIVHKVAAGEAYSLAQILSRGDVLGYEPVQAVSALLSRHYHSFLGEPLTVESCFVQLNTAPENDYLSHISPDGSVQLFEHMHYMGPAGDAEQSERSGDEALKQLNDRLLEHYQDYPTPSALVTDMERNPSLAPLFTAGRRRDIVVLDRKALERRDFDSIFKRLAL